MIKYIIITAFCTFALNLYAKENNLENKNPFQDKIENRNGLSQECNFNQQVGSSDCNDAKKSIIKRIPPADKINKN